MLHSASYEDILNTTERQETVHSGSAVQISLTQRGRPSHLSQLNTHCKQAAPIWLATATQSAWVDSWQIQIAGMKSGHKRIITHTRDQHSPSNEQPLWGSRNQVRGVILNAHKQLSALLISVEAALWNYCQTQLYREDMQQNEHTIHGSLRAWSGTAS